MESSHEGLVKRLNGQVNGLNGQRSDEPDSATQKTQPSALVDEIAQAMKMGRDHFERPQSTGTAPPSNPLPAMAPPRGLFDDEEDDAAMPIPSTWRTPPEPPKTSSLRDQIRAAGLGFITGLAVIVPVVLVMTGRLGDLGIEALFGGGDSPAGQVAQSTTSPAKASVQVQQRTVSTTVITPAVAPSGPRASDQPRKAPATVQAAAPAASNPKTATTTTTAAQPKASWSSAIAEGKRLILAGDILGGREKLMPAVSADEPEAIMALAETYDPNMLAAWGIRDVEADVERARQLYERALRAGVTTARSRLEGLN